MRMPSIIDWLEVLCVVNAIGYLGIWALVGILFWQHDKSVLAKLDAFIDLVREKR